MAFHDPAPTPFDETLRTLGHALGFRSGQTVLCMVSTSASPSFEDLIPTLYRLYELAKVTQAQAWVQCFDAHPQGRLSPLERLVRRVRAQDPGPGQRHEPLTALPGDGGFDPAGSLSTVLAEQAQAGLQAVLPTRTISHVLTVFDGLDVEPWADLVRWPTSPAPALRGLITEQPITGQFPAVDRLAYATKRGCGVPMFAEQPLIVAMEQRQLFLTLDRATSDERTAAPITARLNHRL